MKGRPSDAAPIHMGKEGEPFDNESERRKARNREAQQRWRASHPDLHRQRVSEWERSHRPQRNEYKRQYRRRRRLPPPSA